MKKPKLKIGVLQRKKALVLLNQGLKIDDAVKELKRMYHKNSPLWLVKKTYFPRSGDYAINSLEGASREEILAKIKFMNAARKKASERMSRFNRDPDFIAAKLEAQHKLHADPEYIASHKKAMQKLHNDPVFKAANKARARKTMIKLHKTPGFTEAAKRRIMEFNKDPEFKRKRLAGIAKYWGKYRNSIATTMEELGIKPAWDYRQRVAATTETPDSSVIKKQRTEVINRALNSLSSIQQTVILVTFFSNPKRNLDAWEVATLLNKKESTVKRILKQALTKLAKNRELRQLL
jgi:hypothetical protein